MATLAPGRDMLVIRLVYDGPPQSGKTTSLKMLAGSLSRPISAPEEADGRTLLFDWVEYIGGSYDGLPIRCQIVSVPGQRALHRRRQALLATADAVVFVADTTRRRLAETAECLQELRTLLDARQGPRPGVVVQANKRDETDAEPLAALRVRLGIDSAPAGGGGGVGSTGSTAGIALVESVATEGTGIREAFVLSVRLALDRVRELVAAGALTPRPPDADTADELIAQVRFFEEAAAAADTEPAMPLAAQALREVLAREDDLAASLPGRSPAAAPAVPGSSAPAVRDAMPVFPGPNPAPQGVERRRPPHLPDVAAPSGRVWPPVEGRVVLHAACAAAPGAAAAQRRPDGSWQARVDGWQLHSMAAHEFDELEGGRAELLRWARLYAAGSRRLSPQRCIVLAETGWGRWRLWQIVHTEESLRQRLSAALAKGEPEALAGAMHGCASRLLEARDSFAADPALPCRLGAIGSLRSAPVYIGLLPPASWAPPAAEFEPEDGLLVRREIEPLIRRALATMVLNVARTLDALAGQRPSHALPRRAHEALAAMLIGH